MSYPPSRDPLISNDGGVGSAHDLGGPAVAAMARQFELAPTPFAITEGPAHALRYANPAFRQLLAKREVVVQRVESSADAGAADLTSVLDRAFHSCSIVRDELLAPGSGVRWVCTAWPVATDEDAPKGLVLEIRGAGPIEGTPRQRTIIERLLLGALREQDTARQAAETSRRAEFLARVSRDLAGSLDPDATFDLIRRSALPRKGAWSIVDIFEANGALHRLAIVHPDPAKQAIADALMDRRYARFENAPDVPELANIAHKKPSVVTANSAPLVIAAMHGPEGLSVLRRLGFGALLIVPLVARDTVFGTITFVSAESDNAFSQDEIALASDLCDRCAMALENARLYREAEALRASADEANRAKSEFLVRVGHELRTPLYAIGIYVDLLELTARSALTAEQRSDLGRIKDNQRHLVTVISQLLNFVRAETGHVDYRFAEVPVHSALKDVVELLSGAMLEGRAVPDLPPGDADVVVWADPDRVRQILMNLVMNAVKYTPARSGSIVLSYAAMSDTVLIHVTDSGPGIPKEKLQAIFDPFVQLASGLQHRDGGVGLGLAISRDLARAMKGDITVESTIGVGSRFTIVLPRAPGP